MVRRSRQHRAVAQEIENEVGRALLEDIERNDQFQQSELYEILQLTLQQNCDSSRNIEEMLENQQQECRRQLETYDVLLTDEYLDESEIDEILRQQSERMLELERLQQLRDNFIRQDEPYREVEEDNEGSGGWVTDEQQNNDLFHREMLVDQQLDEQMREMEHYQEAPSYFQTNFLHSNDVCQVDLTAARLDRSRIQIKMMTPKMPPIHTHQW